MRRVLPSVQPETTAAVDVTLSHLQEVRSVVNVSESPSAIDPAQVSSKEQISGIDIIDIPYPATNDYRNVLNFIPGVVQDASGQPHVAGAQTYQTVTLLDGFNVTQPANGLLLVRVSTDGFRSIEVEPSREPAEYGKGSGGVLGLNTGIGNDQFPHHRHEFHSLAARQERHCPRSMDAAQSRSPVRFAPAKCGSSTRSKASTTISSSRNYRPTPTRTTSGAPAISPKSKRNLTSRNILTTSFLFNYLDDQHAGLSPLQPVSTTPSDVEFAYVGTVKDQHYFSGGELLETGFNVDQYNLALTPARHAALLHDPGHSRRQLLSRTRKPTLVDWQGLSNLFFRPHYAHGRHDIKVGVDLDRIDYDAQFLRQPISFWPGQTATTPTALAPPTPAECQSHPRLVLATPHFLAATIPPPTILKPALTRKIVG